MLFALCGLPQAIQSLKQGHSNGLSWTFLMMWLFGEVLTLIYVYPKSNILPLLANYTLNLLFLIVIVWYRAFPRKQ